MELKFWKYEGTGNDFILIDGRDKSLELPGDVIRAMCSRHTGIGADGLVILSPEPGYDFRIKFHNADGGEVNMRGNGGRCVMLFARHLGVVTSDALFLGRDGEHRARIVSDNGESAIIELGMTDVLSYEYSDKAFFFNTGDPHYVEFVNRLDDIDVAGRGRDIRNSGRFKAQGGTNVNFVEVSKHGQIRVRTYELGADDEIPASGTGAIASAIATNLYAQGDCSTFTVSMKGGKLDVAFNSGNRQFTDIRLTGPARRVYEGRVRTGNLFSK